MDKLCIQQFVKKTVKRLYLSILIGEICNIVTPWLIAKVFDLFDVAYTLAWRMPQRHQIVRSMRTFDRPLFKTLTIRCPTDDRMSNAAEDLESSAGHSSVNFKLKMTIRCPAEDRMSGSSSGWTKIKTHTIFSLKKSLQKLTCKCFYTLGHLVFGFYF